MQKEKIIMMITISLMIAVLFSIMFMQFRTVEEIDVTSIELMREEELRTELASWKTKYEEVDKKLKETEETIAEYREKEESNQEKSELVLKELEQANMYLGKTDVQGPGIVVTLEDNEGKDIEVKDILELVNELRLAGAEAISINDQRIVSRSDIRVINTNIILVNTKRVFSPYVIRAIGNQQYLESALTQKQGYMDDMVKTQEKTATLVRENAIKISKFEDELGYRYLTEGNTQE